MSDKKNIASLIIAGLSPKKSKATEEEDMTDDASGETDEEVAAQDVLDAIESKDAAGLAEALKAFVSMC